MASKKRLFIEMGVMTLLIGVTFSILLRQCDLRDILTTIRSADASYLALAIGCMVLFVFCGGWCVRVFFQSMGEKMSVGRCFRYSLTELFFSAITPSSTGGQPMQAVVMVDDGYSATATTAVLLAVAGLYKCAMLAIFFIIYALNRAFLQPQLSGMYILFLLGVAANVILIAIILMGLFCRKLVNALSAKFLNLLLRMKILKNPERAVERLNYRLNSFHECADFMRKHPLTVFRSFLITLLQRLSVLMVPYLVYRALGLSGIGVWQIMGLQLILLVSSDMIPLPGSVGVSESLFLVLYDAIFGKTLLYSAIMLCRGISFYLLLIVSGCSVLFTRYLNLRRKCRA